MRHDDISSERLADAIDEANAQAGLSQRKKPGADVGAGRFCP
jgi:hypothetical protein